MYESITVGKHTQLDEYIKQIIDEGVEHQHKYGAQGKDVDMPEKIRTDYSDGPDKIRSPQQGI